jgi:hypothetical protein
MQDESINDTRKIKQLRTQLLKTTSDADVLKIELGRKTKEYQQKLDSVKMLKAEITKASKTTTLKVSDHAIIRYFERVKGYDISEVEKEILSDKIKQMIETLGGNGTYPNDDYSIVMRDYTVTTIITNP